MASRRDENLFEAGELSEELRERLGIGEGERLRPVETSPRTLVIERLDDGEQIPSDGPSSLRADVAILPVRIRDRVVNVLYVDNGPEVLAETSIAALASLCECIARAYGQLIVEHKRRHC